MSQREKGFTLIELLTVIAIISILIGIALPRFKGMQDESNIAKAKGELRTLQAAVESFYIHNNQTYPPNITALNTAVPSIVTATPVDPFRAAGGQYNYDSAGGTPPYRLYVIYSAGPAGDGVAVIGSDNRVAEANPASCIYVSNAGQDTQP